MINGGHAIRRAALLAVGDKRGGKEIILSRLLFLFLFVAFTISLFPPSVPKTTSKMSSAESDPVYKSIEETKAEYKRLGTSGLRVSVPILGAMSFGDKDWQPWVIEEAEAFELLKAAYDRGLNTW